MNSPSLNDMTRGAARHFSGITFSSTLVTGLVAIALAGIIVLSGAASVISSAFAGSIKEDQPKELIDELVTLHEAKMKEYQERFNKRYVFFKPPPPPPPPRPRVEEPKQPVVMEEPKPSGPPATYPGPPIMWVIGEDVYFNDPTPTLTQKYLRVRVGEEKEGVKVINVDNLPRSVRVGHSGGEYDVKVFGDTMQYSSLFPATPRASILNPNLVPVEQPAPPSPPADAQPAAADAAAAAAAAQEGRGRGNRLAAQPVREERGRGRDRNRDREAQGRQRAEEAGEKPAAEDPNAVPEDEADPEAEGEGEPDETDADGDGQPDPQPAGEPAPAQQPQQPPRPPRPGA